MTDWRPLLAFIRDEVARYGFDLTAAGCVSDYHAAVPPEYALPDHGRPDALAVVIGNTRALWPRFIEAMRASPERARRRDPLDAWTAEVLGPIARAVPAPAAIRYAHEPPPRRVAMQRLADAFGLGQLGPSHLCVRPDVGPWFGLRAVITVDAPGPAARRLRPGPCDRCATRPCLPALDEAMASAGQGWRAWVALRDACPVGADARYGPQQLRYHYEKDPGHLARVVAEADDAR